MARIVDDEPPIKTHPANNAYRENYDRIFGEPEEKPAPTPAQVAVREYLDAGGEPSPIGWYGVITPVEEPRVDTIANVVIDDWTGAPIVAHVQHHNDNTRMTCRNSGKACVLEDLDHHACYTCNKLYDACKHLP